MQVPPFILLNLHFNLLLILYMNPAGVLSHHSYSCLFQSVCCFALYSNPAGVLSHHSYSCLFQSVCRFALCMNPAEVQVTILIHVCFDLLLLVLYMNPASVKSPFFVTFVSICCILGCV